MEKDRQLLEELGDQPILHLYDWEGPSATFGHFIKPEEHFHLGQMSDLRIARRATGGGIIFHTADFAFSLFVPAGHEGYSENTLENYAWVNRQIATLLEKFAGLKPELLPTQPRADEPCAENYCMAHPTKYDLIWKGKKVGGAAQRKTKRGYLHHGTIALGLPSEKLLTSVLKSGTILSKLMREQTFPLLGESFTTKELSDARLRIKELLWNSI